MMTYPKRLADENGVIELATEGTARLLHEELRLAQNWWAPR